MSPFDRAIRFACQGVVLLWIASFLGWRSLAPEEVRVPVDATTIQTRPLPPEEPEAQPEPEEIAQREELEPPELEEIAQREELEPPEPEARREQEAPPEPEPERMAEAPPEPEIPEPLAELPQPEPVLVPEPPAQLAKAEPAARAEPRPRPAPAPLPIAAPIPVAATSLAPEAVPLRRVDDSDVALGGALLTGEGSFPTLESRYEGYGSFRQYADAMQRLGARFVVVRRREIVGTIDPWTLETGPLTDPAGLSPRARDYAGEPELVRADRAVRREHGSRAEVMMLVPRRLDAGLFGGIARALSATGREPGDYRQIRAHYERGPGGTLRLRVETAVRRDGREEPLPLLFDLGSLAAGRTSA